ncbi:MAG: hypothetical protein ISS49_18800 [Anaerolineae bacterium]|nr:hypothetical protein [Anaerolineae bacterium]
MRSWMKAVSSFSAIVGLTMIVSIAAPVEEGRKVQAAAGYTTPLPRMPSVAELKTPVSTRIDRMQAPPCSGFIPPAVDLSHLTGQSMPEGVRAKDLPSRWDWREHAGVTPVKNQGPCGACYAFAAIANVESRLAVDGAGIYDLSENNAKECNWERSGCGGGNYESLANLFSQKGLVLESCDPYVPDNVGCNDTCPYTKTLLDWRIISGYAVPDTEVLKAYIYEYGPVFTTLLIDETSGSFCRGFCEEFRDYDGSYTLFHTARASQMASHAVLLVGWDDNLRHEEGNGGWIFKNSWGTDWGDNGYGTIAYGSANIGMWSSFAYGWQGYDNNGYVMYYDEAGSSDNTSYKWGLCKFFPLVDGKAARVEFWTTASSVGVDVYIYDDFDVETTTLGNLLHSELNHSYEDAGYHSVVLDPPLPVTAGDDVIVVVSFTKGDVLIDAHGPSEIQRTYVSKSGSNGSWMDLGPWGDAGIRLRMTDLAAPPPTFTPTPTPTPLPDVVVLHQFEGGGHLGESVAGVGDVNRDGVPDLVAGAA